MIFLAIVEWGHWILNSPRMPGWMTAIAIIASIYAIISFINGKKKLTALRQGRDGEIAVGQYLEFLREGEQKYFMIYRAKVLIWITS